MSPVFIDTNIPMYAAGAPHPLRQPSQRVIMAIATGQLDAVTDAEVFQEILHRYFRTGEREQGYRVFDDFHQVMVLRILPIEEADVQQARLLAEHHAALSARDLLHLAVLRRHEIREIVTADTGFDAVPGIRRIDPATFVPQ